ncbi:hypothetical protein BHYA_0066g00500 [Botrytis hyacinthi]|uniref:Uncharacterized protein n=1 Tax=Botrytis hyacinthi TaxID=278943 RepID=A0A4Z1GV16_9HELO|nr:hypothetical protein BHYA_0066g00500 [Botrytis hyacinthi]
MARKSKTNFFAHERTQNHELLENWAVQFTDIYHDVHETAMRELMVKTRGLTQDQPAMMQRTLEETREKY